MLELYLEIQTTLAETNLILILPTGILATLHKASWLQINLSLIWIPEQTSLKDDNQTFNK